MGFDRRDLFRMLQSQEMALFLVVVLLFAIVGWINPRFLAERNLLSIFSGNAYIAVAALGMSILIISGHIDISVGALIGVLATVSGSLAQAGAPILFAWTAPIALSIMITTAVGALVAFARIPSIVVTLGMLSVLKGGLISITGGAWINELPEGFHLAQMRPLGAPMPIWFMTALTILVAIWMRQSPLARSFYALGGNAEAARLSGIDAVGTTIRAFALHGFFVGVAAILFATQLSVIQTAPPANLELTIITSSVVGGVSILGGVGTVVGSTLAAVLLAAIASSLIFVDVSPYWMRSIQGALILITVLLDLWRRHLRRSNAGGRS